MPSVDSYSSCGRKTNIHDRLNNVNNVIQYNLVLNCKVRKSASLRSEDCKGNF